MENLHPIISTTESNDTTRLGIFAFAAINRAHGTLTIRSCGCAASGGSSFASAVMSVPNHCDVAVVEQPKVRAGCRVLAGANRVIRNEAAYERVTIRKHTEVLRQLSPNRD